jgi:SAM-dependent methyltransferase
MNKKAWSYKADEFWVKELGTPGTVAADMAEQPEKYLRRHLRYLGEVKGQKIANLLGSCGKKAVPLALLGADVTVVDISEQNRSYALELAREAGVSINYIVSDFLELDAAGLRGYFDTVYLEGGILHYFSDLDEFSRKLHDLLKPGGKLILNDFHPIRKIFKVKDIFVDREDALELTGDYFDDGLHLDAVAHEKYFPENERAAFPKCRLRYWTMGEIITSLAACGFVIRQLDEGPRFDSHKNIPGEFTLVAFQ